MTTAFPSAAPIAEFPIESRTAPALWRYALSEAGTRPAYLEEQEDGWREVSWQEAGERIEALSRSLQARGVRRGDAVAVLSRTRLEWILLDWAIMSIGAVVVGLYPSNTPSECAYVLGHAEAVLAFVEDDAQREKLAAVSPQLPALKEIVLFDDLSVLEAEGRANAPLELHEVQEHDLATLIYTSGTTGPPKGCMLSHKNLVTAALRVRNHIEGETDTVILFLPMAHSFARIAHQSATYRGATLALCADVARLPEALARIHPTILPAVPRVYEKIHANTLSQIERSNGAKRAIGRWALGVGSRTSRLRRAGRPVPMALQMQERIADRLVFSKVRERLGGRLRLGISGAAPLGIDVLEFFHSLGMLVIEGYGLTETSSSLSVNDPDEYKFGTVGRAVDGCEVRLDADGEILVRSETIFSGYYKDPEATAAAFTDDGWFRTGDVGEIDEDGWVKITDRKKDLIITAGGKNIAPQNLEGALKATPYISQVMVHGDKRPYLVALITLNEENVAKWAKDNGIAGSTNAELAKNDRVRQLVQKYIDDLNAREPSYSSIKKFAILPADFSQDTGELTPTLKVKRKFTSEKFRDIIDAFYSN